MKVDKNLQICPVSFLSLYKKLITKFAFLSSVFQIPYAYVKFSRQVNALLWSEYFYLPHYSA